MHACLAQHMQARNATDKTLQVWTFAHWVQDELDAVMEELANMPRPTIGFHIRGGDKLSEDVELVCFWTWTDVPVRGLHIADCWSDNACSMLTCTLANAAFRCPAGADDHTAPRPYRHLQERIPACEGGMAILLFQQAFACYQGYRSSTAMPGTFSAANFCAPKSR